MLKTIDETLQTQENADIIHLEAVFIGEGCRIDKEFLRRSRQIFAGILDVLQENLTKNDAKRPGQTAFNACEYSFLYRILLSSHIIQEIKEDDIYESWYMFYRISNWR